MVREIVPPDTALAFEAVRALRPQFADEEGFVTRVDQVLRPEGYRLVGAFEDAQQAVAVAGFRAGNSLDWGRYIYVDDLSTLSEMRRRGHARALLDWLHEEALRLDCDQLHLDSAVGPQRADAHRLYLNSGLQITAHHFERAVARRP